MELQSLLQQRRMGMFRSIPNSPDDSQLSLYIANRYRTTITNEALWASPFALATIKGDDRRFAERSVREHPAPTPEEVAAAEALMKPHRTYTDGFRLAKQPWFLLVMLTVTLAIYVAAPALIAALAFRGGLVLLIAGVTFVRRDGAWASRLRVFWRAMVAWSPLLLGLVVVIMLRKPLGPLGVALVASLLVGGLTLLSLALPKRGLPDRLAGTWPVPR